MLGQIVPVVGAGEERSGEGTLASRMGGRCETVGNFGADRHNRRGGRGEEWSGDACVAHGGQGRSGRGTGRRATQGSGPHPSSLPPPPARFTKYLLFSPAARRKPLKKTRSVSHWERRAYR